jgi:ubiquinone/menaquinone biosynthesis C-methylase UbiE
MSVLDLKMTMVRGHETEREQERLASILDMVPRNRASVLEVGARDGYIACELTKYFRSVTAVDIEEPTFRMERVITLCGDATRLQFPDDSFDTVLCAEVLEHIPPPKLELACSEIARVAKHDVLIGVPYRQDTRIGQTRCGHCKGLNPPWGHVNTFDRQRLERLFQPLRTVRAERIGAERGRTNFVSAYLMNIAGNPWGTYDQCEPCIHCGLSLQAPRNRSAIQRTSGAIAYGVNKIQSAVMTPKPLWIHMLLEKARSTSSV